MGKWAAIELDTKQQPFCISASKGEFTDDMKVSMSIASYESRYFFLLLDQDGPLRWFKERGT